MEKKESFDAELEIDDDKKKGMSEGYPVYALVLPASSDYLDIIAYATVHGLPLHSVSALPFALAELLAVVRESERCRMSGCVGCWMEK